ncbi:putative aldouronate transport system permease protein [Lachnotalea glycerini]|jgi:putative aldouronate transport system permease protein|uniref:Carbohydrate ABC transporter permease n=1 Tax=Lachnotalea glycerini TaxID=1763509 RepID=A0A255I6M1_9FIRM|nr:carbohydrate ABC transporter permease [Lachnotalea glycerini]PXV91214.1 putative aldouronate transport system permease protein [Lachnotalea glycerini]RDY31624.1 carbohydrate ABC transporter permease [Lachnotalea glycerini]
MKLKKRKRLHTSDILIDIVTFILMLLCLLPLMNVVATSFSSSAAATAGKVGILPVDFTVNAYRKILDDHQFWRSFMISVVRVILGTALNIALVVTMAYPLSKNRREFYAQGIYIKFVLFAMLFNGGMVPLFMIVNKLGLLNSIWSLVLPQAVGVGNVILLMNFFRSVPKSLEEAAEIDGANPVQILTYIFLPASKPCIATICLFCIVGHWNDYFSGILYISKTSNYPLQTYIQLISATFDLSKVTDIEKLKQYLMVSTRTLNSAKIVISVIPLLIIYPLLQKYFTTGLVVGAVKE